MENQLTVIKCQQVLTDSLLVAEKFKKNHYHVIEKIKNIIKDDEKDALTFRVIFYTDSMNRKKEMYEMDRKSFSILCMSFTGKKALQWKLKFYDAFETMEKALLQLMLQKQDATWLAQRTAGKVIRLEETDTIKEFVEYAIDQGSKNANRYYCNITKMQNQALFLLEQKFKNLREILNLNQLATINTADAIVSKALRDGMSSKLHYKEVYKLAKARVTTFSELRGKTLIPATQQLELKTATA